jgi:hypothetical protein
MGRRTSRCENSETNDEPKGGGGEDSREEEVKNKRVNSCETSLQNNRRFPHSTLPYQIKWTLNLENSEISDNH